MKYRVLRKSIDRKSKGNEIKYKDKQKLKKNYEKEQCGSWASND